MKLIKLFSIVIGSVLLTGCAAHRQTIVTQSASYRLIDEGLTNTSANVSLLVDRLVVLVEAPQRAEIERRYQEAKAKLTDANGNVNLEKFLILESQHKEVGDKLTAQMIVLKSESLKAISDVPKMRNVIAALSDLSDQQLRGLSLEDYQSLISDAANSTEGKAISDRLIQLVTKKLGGK